MRGQEAAEARIQKARRGTAASAMGNQLERAVAVALDRALAPVLKEMPLIIEKVEILNGDRSRAAGKAAVTRDHLAELGKLGDPVSRKAAGATPTAAEFDALVRDIHKIFDTLKALQPR